MSLQIVEIRDFTLFYYGFFSVSFEFEGKKHHFPLLLPLAELIKILQENDLISSIENVEFGEGVRMTKSVLKLEYKNGEFIQPDFLNEYDEDFQEDYDDE